MQYPWLFSSFMPSIVAGHLGVKGVVVSGGGERDKDDKGRLKIKAFEKQPRGGLGTFARVDEETKWLRVRNRLLRDFGSDGKARILVCEDGICREEDMHGIELGGGSVEEAVPAKGWEALEKEEKEISQPATVVAGKENVKL